MYYRFTYEIAPVFTVMETILLKKMYEIIGWGETEGDGLFSPGKKKQEIISICQMNYMLGDTQNIF